MTAIGGTTVGPLKADTRDRLAAYRDREGHEHYQAAITALLDQAERRDYRR
jgi:hypothetical protein